jgi:hypothetical protein
MIGVASQSDEGVFRRLNFEVSLCINYHINMPDPTYDINFKKTLQTERNQKEKRNKIFSAISILIIISALVFLYQKYSQPKIQTEVLPNTSLSQINNSNQQNSGNINSPTSVPPKTINNLPNEVKPAATPSQNNNPESNSIFYTGKIDDKIPFRIKLDYNGAGAGNAEYTGLEVYDGVSEQTLAIKARTVNSPSPDYCPDSKCNFTMQEFDNSETDPDKILALDKPVGDFQGTFDMADTKMNKITGIWTKADGSQKLKCELNRSDYYGNLDSDIFLTNMKSPDGEQYLSSSICTEQSNIGDICYAIINTRNNLKFGEVLARQANWSGIEFGKKIDTKQYLIQSFGDTCSASVEVFVFDNTSRKLTQIDTAGKQNPCNLQVETSCKATENKNGRETYGQSCFKSTKDYQKYLSEGSLNDKYWDLMSKYSLPKQ